MNGLDLQYFITAIDETVNHSHAGLNDIFMEKQEITKTRLLCENIGELHGHLLFIKSQMQEEIEIRSRKKFWQFWK